MNPNFPSTYGIEPYGFGAWDLPTDAEMWELLDGNGNRRPGNSLSLAAVSVQANRHWEFRHETHQSIDFRGFVWRSWPGDANAREYYVAHGRAITRDEAIQLSVNLNSGSSPWLRLPEGL